MQNSISNPGRRVNKKVVPGVSNIVAAGPEPIAGRSFSSLDQKADSDYDLPLPMHFSLKRRRELPIR
jgi:hypothetical protein